MAQAHQPGDTMGQPLSVTITAAAELLGVSRTAVGAWVREGRIPTHRFPGMRHPRIRVSALEQFIDELEDEARAEREGVRRTLRVAGGNR